MTRFSAFLTFALLQFACGTSPEDAPHTESPRNTNHQINDYRWDTPPKVVNSPNISMNPTIDYEDNVYVMLDISTEGTVDTAWVAKSLNYPVLDSLALEYVQRLVFVPAKKDGKAITVRVSWPVVFRNRKNTPG